MANLALMQQQLLLAQRIGVEDVALLVGADVHAADQHLAVLDDGEALLEVHAPLAHALDLRAVQLHAALDALLDEVIVERLFVLCHGLDALCARHAITSLQAAVHHSIAQSRAHLQVRRQIATKSLTIWPSRS